MRKCVAIGALLLCFIAHSAETAYFCCQPSSPSCASRYGAFDDEDDFARCKRQITNFKDETEEFLRCLKRNSDAVIQDYNSAVESFNRRARG